MFVPLIGACAVVGAIAGIPEELPLNGPRYKFFWEATEVAAVDNRGSGRAETLDEAVS